VTGSKGDHNEMMRHEGMANLSTCIPTVALNGRITTINTKI
jgi:hypothetical protein